MNKIVSFNIILLLLLISKGDIFGQQFDFHEGICHLIPKNSCHGAGFPWISDIGKMPKDILQRMSTTCRIVVRIHIFISAMCIRPVHENNKEDDQS